MALVLEPVAATAAELAAAVMPEPVAASVVPEPGAGKIAATAVVIALATALMRAVPAVAAAVVVAVISAAAAIIPALRAERQGGNPVVGR